MTDVTSEDARPTEHRISTVRWSRLPAEFGASMARCGRSVILVVVALAIDADMGLHASGLGAPDWPSSATSPIPGGSAIPTSLARSARSSLVSPSSAGHLLSSRGFERRGLAVFDRGAGYIAGSLVVAGWFVLFPEHALRHTFTVRATLIWIIGGSGWLCAARASGAGEKYRSCERSPAS